MENIKLFLTRKGILATSNRPCAFFTNEGKFVRSASTSEVNWLINEIKLTKIVLFPKETVLENSELITWVKNPKNPKWHFIGSVEKGCDESNYKWET
jgi:hypothetical protein